MKPALISDFNPGDRIAKSCSNYREVEARIVGDKVSFSVLINEGLKICRLDQPMLRSVRDRSQSDPRDLEVFDQLRFGIYCYRRAKLLSALPDREVEVLISQPYRLPGEVFDRFLIEQVKKELPIVLKSCLHIVRQS